MSGLEEEKMRQPVKEEEWGDKPVVEVVTKSKVPKYKQGKFVYPTPEDEDLYSSGITRKNAGFSETIVPRINGSTGPGPIIPNTKPLCPQIFNIGKKVNNKFFIPSQFPNLTKKKSLLKEGIKHMNTQNKNKKVISRTETSRKGIKGITRKEISKKETSRKVKGIKGISRKGIKGISRKGIRNK